MRLRFDIAVAVAKAGNYSYDSTPNLGTSICHGCGPKKDKEKKSFVFHFNLPIGSVTFFSDV